MNNEDAYHEDKDFWIKELSQEKFLAKNVIDHLVRNDVLSHEVFDSLSHELRTPVVTIKAYLDMLLEGHFGELRLEQREKIEQINENTDFLIKTISEILEKSKKIK